MSTTYRYKLEVSIETRLFGFGVGGFLLPLLIVAGAAVPGVAWCVGFGSLGFWKWFQSENEGDYLLVRLEVCHRKNERHSKHLRIGGETVFEMPGTPGNYLIARDYFRDTRCVDGTVDEYTTPEPSDSIVSRLAACTSVRIYLLRILVP